MEKITIEENSEQQDAAIKKINSFCAKVNEALVEFKTDTGYSPTFDEVKKLIQGQDLSGLRENVNSSLESQLDKQKVSGKLMRENLKAGVSVLINTLSKNLNIQSVVPGSEYLHFLSMQAGKIELKKEQEEEIRETFRNCLTTEEGKFFFDLHKSAAQSINELSKFISQKTTLQYSHIDQLTKNFFDMDFNTGEIDINSIDYETCIQRRKTRGII